MLELVKRWRGLSLSMFRFLRDSSTNQLEIVLMEGTQDEEEEERDFFDSYSMEQR